MLKQEEFVFSCSNVHENSIAGIDQNVEIPPGNASFREYHSACQLMPRIRWLILGAQIRWQGEKMESLSRQGLCPSSLSNPLSSERLFVIIHLTLCKMRWWLSLLRSAQVPSWREWEETVEAELPFWP